jgi:hypothetical protein
MLRTLSLREKDLPQSISQFGLYLLRGFGQGEATATLKQVLYSISASMEDGHQC